MQKERLVVNGDGTITDIETGLMWTASVIGKDKNGKICEGNANRFTWSEATKLFGRGRDIPVRVVSPEMFNQVGETTDIYRRGKEIWVKSLRPDLGEMIAKELTAETYKNYEFADYPRIFIGGYNDWRLPTIEELWTLVYDRYYEDRLIGKFMREPFGHTSDLYMPMLWTANRSEKGVAWEFQLTTNNAVKVNIGEATGSEPHPVYLVREGKVFNSVFGQIPRKESFTIVNNEFRYKGKYLIINDLEEFSTKPKPSLKRILFKITNWIGSVGMVLIGLVILLGLFIFNSFWFYLLIPILALLAISKIIEVLQNKNHYHLEAILKNGNQHYFDGELEELKEIEKIVNDYKKFNK